VSDERVTARRLLQHVSLPHRFSRKWRGRFHTSVVRQYLLSLPITTRSKATHISNGRMGTEKPGLPDFCFHSVLLSNCFVPQQQGALYTSRVLQSTSLQQCSSLERVCKGICSKNIDERDSHRFSNRNKGKFLDETRRGSRHLGQLR
jgi:hypothetical protein